MMSYFGRQKIGMQYSPKNRSLKCLPAISGISHNADIAISDPANSESNRTTNSPQLGSLLVGLRVGHLSPRLHRLHSPSTSWLALFGELCIEKLLATLRAGFHHVSRPSH
jgi:hypothetical protein